MAESHKAVLDREYAVETAKHFKDSLDLLNDLLDYGTNLIPRAFVSSPRDLKAICIIFVQLRQFLVHLDGVVTLATAGNCATATLQLRSLLETAHTLEWLLAVLQLCRSGLICWANAPCVNGFRSVQVEAIRTGSHPSGGWLVSAFFLVVPG